MLGKNVPGESCGKERIGFDKENIPPPPVRALEEKMSPTLERLKKRLKEFEDKASEARMITAIKSQLLDELKMPRKLDEDVRVPPFEHEYDDITPSSELSVNTGKIVLLTNRKLKKTEVGAMGRLFDVKDYLMLKNIFPGIRTPTSAGYPVISLSSTYGRKENESTTVKIYKTCQRILI
jgi:hypothetical protein